MQFQQRQMNCNAMPFSISIKGSSNKQETLAQKDDFQSTQEAPEGQHPHPFMDKISVTLTVPTVDDGQAMWNAHWDAIKDQTTFSQAKTGKGYKKAYRISLPSVLDARKWPHYQIGFNEQGTVTRLRIEFVPADLGFQGLEDLHFALCALMEGGWTYFIMHGRITRVDVALDFPGASMDEFHFLPVQSAWQTHWSPKGKLTSLQHGKPQGSCTMVYDRGQKRKDKGQSSKTKTGVRVERRVRHLAMSFAQLPDLQNPFGSMAMVKRTIDPPPGEAKQPYVWPFFMAMAEKAGLSAALAMLPEKKRGRYRKHLKLHMHAWWHPTAFWTGWSSMLADLKISDAKAWP